MKNTLISRQSRRPSGLLGHLIARGMARDTAKCNEQAVRMLDVAGAERILEIGCGHGRTLARIAAQVPGARLAGVDFSDTMCGIARRYNGDAIRAGQMEIHHGDSATLPFDDALFDRAFSVHTIYFWPDPERDIRELHRVLQPEGRVLIGYRPNDDGALTGELPPDIYRLYTTAGVEELLAAAGFRDVTTTCAIVGRKEYAFTVGVRGS